MSSPRSIDEVLADSRDGVDRVEPGRLHSLLENDGAHVIDVRSAVTRDVEGHIPGAVVVERLVLEWRLDPASPHRMEGGPAHTDLVVVVCNEGYHSSLAARELRRLGFSRATDLAGGFRAWMAGGFPVEDRPTRYVD